MSALGFKARVDPSLARFLTCLILRFTSGVTPADLLTASMVVESPILAVIYADAIG